jgi:hypothetical protein
MTLRRKVRLGVLILLILVLVATSVRLDALNVQTHRLINTTAAGKSTDDDYANTFDRYLRESLGLAAGRVSVLQVRGQRLIPELWLAEGGEREDDGSPFSPTARFYRHFHNPLQPWDRAGLLTRYPFFPLPHQYTSSIRWMQSVSQAIDGSGSHGPDSTWRDARLLYARALTTANAREREGLTADLFRTLGQIMHLVVDASVPEHARNDPHPFGAVSREVLRSRTATNYEYWVSNEQQRLGDSAFAARYLSVPIGFDQRLFRILPPSGETAARLPLGRLIDADSYLPEAPDPNDTLSGTVGIAEVANANFFSEDTRFGVDTQNRPLPFPRLTDLVRRADTLVRRADQPAPRANVRRYFEKPEGHGLPNRFALAECRLDGEYDITAVPYPCVDESVWHQTAAAMLPRAVGYARGVLDYFFRGTMTVTRVEWTSTGVNLRVLNTSEDEMDGVFEIYARHSAGTPQERRVRFATLNGGLPLRLAAGGRRTLSITVPPDAEPTPSYVLVMTGRLGLETDAVVGHAFTVPYVEVHQASYHTSFSPQCGRPPANGAPASPGFVTRRREEAMRCDWRMVNHRVHGTIETNMPLDPLTMHPAPVIESIEARWSGGASEGRAPLMLDGSPVDGVWLRRGQEPDPTTFEILDPADRGTAGLFLTVNYRGGGTISAHLARFNSTQSAHHKAMWADLVNLSAPRYLVMVNRSMTATMSFNWASTNAMMFPLFETLTIGGSPRTDTRQFKPFGSASFGDGLLVNTTMYLESPIDVFEILVDLQAADDKYAAIEPLLNPHPDGPTFAWVAELQRRYQPMEREFLRAFVTANPPPYRVSLTAAEGDGP